MEENNNPIDEINNNYKFGYNVISNDVKTTDVGFMQKENEERIHPFLPSSFISLIIGKPGSGKTYLLQSLLLNPKLYFKFFNHVYIISPYKFNKELCTSEVFISEFNISSIYQNIINKHDILQKKKEKESQNVTVKKQHILIIIDDFISRIKQEENNKSMIDLFYNRRHLVKNTTISFIITTQKYVMLPLKIRACLTSLYMFKTNNKELGTIINEVGFIPLKTIKDLIVKFGQTNAHMFILFIFDMNKILINFDEIKY